MRFENEFKYPCLSLQRKGLAQAQPALECAWLHTGREEDIDRWLLLLCKPCTKFPKKVQVYLSKTPKFPYWVGD